MKLLPLVSALSVLAFSAPLGAQDSSGTPPSRITTGEIDAHLRFLSSDLLEGRAPGTRGGRLAAQYIASQLANSETVPTWNRDAEFRAAREAALHSK